MCAFCINEIIFFRVPFFLNSSLPNKYECDMFMQDGVSRYRSKVVSDFLKKKNIKMLDWPGNSPDLNLIENLWPILKDKVADKHPTIAKDLELAKRIWTQKITAEYCKHLVHNMLCCLQAVIKNKGGYTIY